MCQRRFNVFNQLEAVILADGTAVEFLYDAFSRRIAKKAGGKKTRFYWDQFRMTAENSDQSQTSYIYYPNTFVPLCCHKDGNSYFYQTDHLGAPMEITDAHGQLVWLAAYDTYGACRTSETFTFENSLRSQGQYHDTETGLHYNWGHNGDVYVFMLL